MQNAVFRSNPAGQFAECANRCCKTYKTPGTEIVHVGIYQSGCGSCCGGRSSGRRAAGFFCGVVRTLSADDARRAPVAETGLCHSHGRCGPRTGACSTVQHYAHAHVCFDREGAGAAAFHGDAQRSSASADGVNDSAEGRASTQEAVVRC